MKILKSKTLFEIFFIVQMAHIYILQAQNLFINTSINFMFQYFNEIMSNYSEYELFYDHIHLQSHTVV